MNDEEVKNEGTIIKLKDNWTVQSSKKLMANGWEISNVGFKENDWYKASVPNTIMSILVENKLYQNIFVGKNLRKIPGTSYKIGTNFSNQEIPDDSPFSNSWWYRTEFKIPVDFKNKTVILTFKGINYRANVWLNGKKICNSDEVVGAFREFSFDVSKDVKTGGLNALAIEVFPPRAKDLSITFVDWNPAPPDKNMGLWKDVLISSNNGIEMKNTTVESALKEDKDGKIYAELRVGTTLRNYTKEFLNGILKGTISKDGVKFTFSIRANIDPNQKKDFYLSDNNLIRINDPKLWWPYSMGEPTMYELNLEYYINENIRSSSEVIKFGISQITSERTGNNDILLKINNKPLLIKGAGWSPDMLLRVDENKRDIEFLYVKDMGLNTIRLEGKLEDEKFFERADEEGILIIVGWCCCDAWEKWNLWDTENYEVAKHSLTDQLYRLRRHPSIVLWMNGSDYIPPEKVERLYLEIESNVRWNKPVVSTAKNLISKITGFSGVKMNGPYDYVPPVYWYVARHIGGALGFNTETGSGPSIPTIEDLKSFIPEDKLWPINSFWNYHAGGGPFKTIQLFQSSLEKRYGTPKDLEDFFWKSQAMNYESQRAMFEAYTRERYNSTGVVQWMLNNAWPSIIWHLYSYNLIQSGSYFGTKKALKLIHVQYSYDDSSIVIINNTYNEKRNLKVCAMIFNTSSKKIWNYKTEVNCYQDSTLKIFYIPKIDFETYFLYLELIDENGVRVDDNFYWLSSRLETLDYDKTTFYHTPQISYASFKDLERLEKIRLEAFHSTSFSNGECVIKLIIKNPTEVIAFMIRIRVKDGYSGKDLVPVIYQDNYLSLLPKDNREITLILPKNILNGNDREITIDGYNVIESTSNLK